MRDLSGLPDGWRIVRLEQIAQERRIRANSAPQADVYSVTKHYGFVRSLEYFERQVFSRDTSNYKVVQRGDLAYATIHLDEGSLGILRDADAGLISPMYTVFAVDKQQVDPDFLFALMKLPQMVARYGRIGEGSVHRRKSISFKRLGRLTFAIPPVEEQRQAMAVLEAIDEAIECTEAVISATERLRDALLHELLTRGVPGWHTEWRHVPGLGTVPADWQVIPLGDAGRWLSGGTPSKARSDFWVGQLPWVSPKDMKARALCRTQDHISQEGARTGSRVVPKGAIFVVVRGMILAHSFPIAVSRVAAAFNQDIRALVCCDGLLPGFVLAALEHQKPRLLHLPSPSTHGTMRVVSEDLFAILIPTPSSGEQRAIAAVLGRVDDAIARTREDRLGLESFKASAADALLTGRMRAPVLMEAMLG